MTQQQQDVYKSLIGDGQARVSVGREMSESDYGSGGKAFVSVSLACDQSANGISGAINLASQVADFFVTEHHKQVKQRCIEMGLLKDPNAGRPTY